MNVRTTHTAILFFARSAEAEQQAKPILKSEKGVRWNADLLQHGLTISEQSGLPVHWISEAEQQGHTFGERLTHAYEQVFDLGYERVIAIGNDCLSLTGSDLRAAAAALDHHDWVLGPAKDGGAYLIGTHRECFEAERFAALPWEKEALWDALLSHIPSAAIVHQLSRKADIDCLPSLVTALQKSNCPRLLRYWRTIVLPQPIRPQVREVHFLPLRSAIALPLRAPPVS